MKYYFMLLFLYAKVRKIIETTKLFFLKNIKLVKYNLYYQNIYN
jgi:hypothetical protein